MINTIQITPESVSQTLNSLIDERVALKKETERLTHINTWLKDPEGCHAANPGETGYYCDVDNLCTPCRLRHAEAKLEEVSDLVNLAISGITPPSTLMDKALESLNQAADLLAQPTKQLEPITSIADAKLKKVRARVTDSLRRHGLVTQKEDQ